MRGVLVLISAALLGLGGADAAIADTPQPVAPVPAPIASQLPRSHEAPDISERIIVVWEASVSAGQRTAARSDADVEHVATLGRSRFQVLTPESGQSVSDAIDQLRADPSVKIAERDHNSGLHGTTNDPNLSSLWGLADTVAGSKAFSAWDKTIGDRSVVVADLDTGFRSTHPDLAATTWTNPLDGADGIDNDGNGVTDDTHGIDFVGADADLATLVKDNDPTDTVMEGSAHGVHTAGTIAADGNNGQGVTGVAQKATIMPIRVCGYSPSGKGVTCPNSAIIAGINYAGSHGAPIANMSLGGTYNDLAERAAIAANPNTLFVVSAGNETNDNDVSATYPCSFPLDNVVCVAATDKNTAVASYSNWGRTSVDLAAPGSEILSTSAIATYWYDFFDATWPTGWTAGGWTRVSPSPADSGYDAITNGTSTQGTGATRTVTTPTVSVVDSTQCQVDQYRSLTTSGVTKDVYSYTVYVDGVAQPVVNSTTQGKALESTYVTLPNTGTHAIKVSLSYKRNGTSSTDGVWVHYLWLDCMNAPGTEDSYNYQYMSGTSMAAPHVSGAAALLKSYEAGATVANLRSALLTSVDAVAALNPTTGSRPVVTGGKLNAILALAKIDQSVAPNTQLTAQPANPSTADVSFSFVKKDTLAPATFECSLDGATYAACTSPKTYSGLGGLSHTFNVRAKDDYSNVDASPAGYSWTVNRDAPTISSLNVTSGSIFGGTAVTINGTNFWGTPSVMFGANNCTAVSVTSATTLNCTTPAGATTGLVNVSVTNQDTKTVTKTGAFTYTASAPTVTGVSVASGPQSGGTSVTVTGTGFWGTPTVSFGGSPCTPVNRTNATSLTCTTTSHQPGPVAVTVTNPDTTAGTSSASLFTYIAAPSVASVTPIGGPPAGGTSVTVTGANFTGTPTVSFGGASCTGVNTVTATSLKCTTTSHVVGAVTVTVTNPDGQYGTSPSSVYTYAAGPTVASVTPSGGPLAGATVVTVAGTGFAGTPAVTFDGLGCTAVNSVTATSLKCTTPAHSAGAVTVAVTNPDTQTGTLASAYTYAPKPTISGVVPASGPLAGGNTVTIGGTGFSTNPTVTFAGTPCTNVNRTSAFSVSCTAPAHAAGPVTLTVTNTDGQFATSTYTYAVAPTVTGVAPISGPAGGQAIVTVTGTGFSGTPTVSLGGSACTAVNTVTATSLKCTTPSHAAGPVTVTVTNPDGQSGSKASAYTFIAAPRVDGVTPAGGPLAGGTLVTISGANFYGAPTVVWDGGNCTNITVVSAASLTCRVPAGSAGEASVTVTNPDSQSLQLFAAYTYTAAPILTSVSPTSGRVGGGTDVIVTGANFTGASAVSFGGSGCTVTAGSVTATSLHCTTSSHAAGAAAVTVMTFGNQTSTQAVSFTYVVAPTVVSVSPTSGPAAGGTTVTVDGTNFSASPTVSIGGSACTPVTRVDATKLTCNTGSHAAGAGQVVVTNDDLQVSSQNVTFTYKPAPTVSGLEPSAGPAIGGTPVTIMGTGFDGTPTVKFGATDCTNVNSVTSTSLKCTSPAHAPGEVAVTVTVDGQQSAAGPPILFTYTSAPTVTGVNPSSGPQAGGTVVTIAGTGFAGTPQVTFGTASCTSVNRVDVSTLTCQAPAAAAAGPVTVTVTNPDAQSGSLQDAWTYLAPVADPGPSTSPTPVAHVGVVTGLKAKRVKKGKVARLTWTAATDAVRYEYACAPKSAKVSAYLPVTGTKATCKALKPAKTYRAWVRAVGTDSYSTPASVTIRRWR